MGANTGAVQTWMNEFKSRKSVTRLTKVRMGSSPIAHKILRLTCIEENVMKWFRDVFLKSFDECKGKRISEKQAEVFIRYLPDSFESDNACYYTGMIDRKNIKVQESPVYSGCRYTSKGRHTIYRNEYYLTITTEEI